MAPKTLIRSSKKHEVKLAQGSQVAQSQPPHVADEAPVPPLIRKGTAGRRNSATDKPPARASSPAQTAPTRKKASAPAPAPLAPLPPARKRATPRTSADKRPPSPRLPARVPADGLWETDSPVQQRLQALLQRNAQLSEQLQRLQSQPVPKGHKP